MWTGLWRRVSVKGNKEKELVDCKGRCTVRGRFCVLQRKKVIEQRKRKERVVVDGFEASIYEKRGARSPLCGCRGKQSVQSSLRHKPLASTAEPNILLNRCVSIHYRFSDRQMASSDSMSLLGRPKLRTQ